jgi:hypothetical protein
MQANGGCGHVSKLSVLQARLADKATELLVLLCPRLWGCGHLTKLTLVQAELVGKATGLSVLLCGRPQGCGHRSQVTKMLMLKAGLARCHQASKLLTPLVHQMLNNRLGGCVWAKELMLQGACHQVTWHLMLQSRLDGCCLANLFSCLWSQQQARLDGWRQANMRSCLWSLQHARLGGWCQANLRSCQWSRKYHILLLMQNGLWLITNHDKTLL